MKNKLIKFNLPYPKPYDLVIICKSGVDYSSVAATQSALSSLLNNANKLTFGKQEIVKRYVKGVLNL